MTLLAALAAALAVWVLGLRPRRIEPAGRRIGRAGSRYRAAGLSGAGARGGSGVPGTTDAGARGESGVPVPLAAAAAALGAWTLAGPRAGPLAALLAAAAVPRLLAELPTRARAERDLACAAAVPLLADLVAACVAAGAPLDAAVEEAAAVVGGPLGDDAATAARAVRLGVPPAVAWAALLAPDRPPPVRSLARALARSADSGAAPAAVLCAVADDARAAARAAGEAAARRAAVVAVLPLGLCFLPAFVLVGVVPLVAGLVGDVL